MQIEFNPVRYSVIEIKNKREIVMLRGSGCKWRRCKFCDYHMDYSQNEQENYQLNRSQLEQVTGCYQTLEVINSGSFVDLDTKTMHFIRTVCMEKQIAQVHFESHFMHREEIENLRNFFAEVGIMVKMKIGIESFDITLRETVLDKGIGNASPKEIQRYFDEICLLFGLKGQTLLSMQEDIETGLAYFERVCINIMQENTTSIKPDEQVIQLFAQELYPQYIENHRVDILMVNTEFGVGGTHN